MSEVELVGWDDLIRNLDALAPRAEKNILRGMVRLGANEVRDAIKDKAPILKPDTLNPHERYPGQLRDSVVSVSVQIPNAAAAGVKIRGSREELQSAKQAGRALGKGKLKAAANALAQAMADGFYWRWVEFGSPHNTPAQPFIRPGWDGVKGSLLDRMAAYGRERLSDLIRD